MTIAERLNVCRNYSNHGFFNANRFTSAFQNFSEFRIKLLTVVKLIAPCPKRPSKPQLCCMQHFCCYSLYAHILALTCMQIILRFMFLRFIASFKCCHLLFLFFSFIFRYCFLLPTFSHCQKVSQPLKSQNTGVEEKQKTKPNNNTKHR